MKEILFKNWSFMRWLRLAISFGFVVAFTKQNDWFLLFVGIFFLVQVIFNIGCNNGNCAVPLPTDKKKVSI